MWWTYIIVSVRLKITESVQSIIVLAAEMTGSYPKAWGSSEYYKVELLHYRDWILRCLSYSKIRRHIRFKIVLRKCLNSNSKFVGNCSIREEQCFIHAGDYAIVMLLVVFENEERQKTSRPRRTEVTGGWRKLAYTKKRFIICTARLINCY